METKIRKSIVTQIGILTDDIQRSKAAWEAFFGLSPQPVSTSEGYAKTAAVYDGRPLEGRIYQACFNLQNIEVSLSSLWTTPPRTGRNAWIATAAACTTSPSRSRIWTAALQSSAIWGLRYDSAGSFPTAVTPIWTGQTPWASCWNCWKKIRR